MSTQLKDEASIEQILSEMTLTEKAELVTGATPFATQKMEKYGIPSLLLLDGGTGFNAFQYDCETGFCETRDKMAAEGKPIDRESFGGIQGFMAGVRAAMEKRAGQDESENTPKEYGCYPPGMLLGATWNAEAVHACAGALAQEMGSYGVDVILGSPNVNIHRDPLGGRMFEGYSEDPCLVSKLAPSFVEGVQQEGVLADVKHFAANNQETDRMGVNEHISERALREIYFPGFRACVEAGCYTVMSSYNKINGIPSAMNHWLLTDVLRDEWKFNGFVMSDWGGAYDLVDSLAAGNDLAMPGPRAIREVVEAVESGRLKEEQLDHCVRNFLKIVLKAPAMTNHSFEYDKERSRKATEFAAKEGITLLKNDGVLPLHREQKVAFWGKRSKAFCGSGEGSAGVETCLLTNPYDCVAEYLGVSDLLFEEAEADTEIYLVTVGANGQEGSDRLDMEMDENDAASLEKALSLAESNGGKVVLLLNTEGPVDLDRYEDRLAAIVCAYYPGMEGGKVLADILYGEVNPSGKLPFTYPRHYYDVPSYKNFPGENKEVYYGEGIYVGYRHYDARHIKPLYPFGFGLSYTSFVLSGLQIPEKVDLEQELLNVSLQVANTGTMDGAEVVQLYLHAVAPHMDKPVKELKAFKKVFVPSGESKTVMLSLNKRDFQSYSPELGRWACEPGMYEVWIGTSAEQICLRQSVQVECCNDFGILATSPVNKIVTNAETVTLLNQALHQNVIALLGNTLLVAPLTPFDQVWKEILIPALREQGMNHESIEALYQKVLVQ